MSTLRFYLLWGVSRTSAQVRKAKLLTRHYFGRQDEIPGFGDSSIFKWIWLQWETWVINQDHGLEYTCNHTPIMVSYLYQLAILTFQLTNHRDRWCDLDLMWWDDLSMLEILSICLTSGETQRETSRFTKTVLST